MLSTLIIAIIICVIGWAIYTYAKGAPPPVYWGALAIWALIALFWLMSVLGMSF